VSSTHIGMHKRCANIKHHAHTCWQRLVPRQYRKYDTDRTPYGLGYELLLLKDTRKFAPVYLGRFYDWSIDEE
jgi:hypothetical protein